jgi:hypothetical protein
MTAFAKFQRLYPPNAIGRCGTIIWDALGLAGRALRLRRMAGDPVLGEAYRLAEIVVGRVGPEQAKPGREFEQNKGAIGSNRATPN